ncbi:Regulation of nuclear pre-mRNA domain-containing protein 1B [Linum grandiflorum]
MVVSGKKFAKIFSEALFFLRLRKGNLPAGDCGDCDDGGESLSLSDFLCQDSSRMGDDVFDEQVLSDKLSKLNNSQASIECILIKSDLILPLSRWCVTHRKKARQVVESWDQLFKSSQRDQRVSFLYLANDILQNSRRKGSEFVNEFWKVLPKALKLVHESGGDSGKKAVARLVDIWEERKVFGSRAQSLKDEMLGKIPLPPVASNGKSPNPSLNPIKIVKRDANSLRIKLAVGGTPEKILTAFQCVLDDNRTEEDALDKSSTAVSHLGKIREDIENTSIAGNQPGLASVDELQVQENVLHQCVGQLETAEKSRASLISQLKEALKEQESKLDTIHSQLQVVRGHIEESSSLRKRLGSVFRSEPPSATTVAAADSATVVEQIPSPSQPPNTTPQPPVSQSFAPLKPSDEETKKAAAAAMAAKLSASSSSAQMLSSVLSSLVAEELNGSLKSAGFSTSLSDVLPPEKRARLENPGSATDAAGSFFSTAPVMPPSIAPSGQMQSSFGTLPTLPLQPPIWQTGAPANQYMQQQPGMMPNMIPYGYGVASSLPPPPPPLPPQFGLGMSRPPQQSQPQDPSLTQQQQTPTTGGYYRPPGIGFYGPMHQATTATHPVPRQ